MNIEKGTLVVPFKDLAMPSDPPERLAIVIGPGGIRGNWEVRTASRITTHFLNEGEFFPLIHVQDDRDKTPEQILIEYFPGIAMELISLYVQRMQGLKMREDLKECLPELVVRLVQEHLTFIKKTRVTATQQ